METREQLMVINFTNIDSEDFEGMWGGEIYPIKKGETKPFPAFLAEHLAGQLSQKMAMKNNGGAFDKGLTDPFKEKILGKIKVPAETPVNEIATAPEFEGVPTEPEVPLEAKFIPSTEETPVELVKPKRGRPFKK